MINDYFFLRTSNFRVDVRFYLWKIYTAGAKKIGSDVDFWLARVNLYGRLTG